MKFLIVAMKSALFFIFIGIFFTPSAFSNDFPAFLTDRLVFTTNRLNSDKDEKKLASLINRASSCGMNGLVWTSQFGSMDMASPAFFKRLERIRILAEKKKIELIPCAFSVGYGKSVIKHNPNLAAGLPVNNAVFTVSKNRALPEQDKSLGIANGDFEDWNHDFLEGFIFNDRPGITTISDRKIFRTGKSSLRLQKFGEVPHGHARIMQTVQVRPYHQYCVSVWVKTKNLMPAHSLELAIYAGNKQMLGSRLASGSWKASGVTNDWKLKKVYFNSRRYDNIQLYLGIWGGKSGTVWLDHLQISDAGLSNVLRRPGTPLSVGDSDGKITYEEGRDFAFIHDPYLLMPHPDSSGPAIEILPGSRIKEGARLLLNFYNAASPGGDQVPICMSEAELYQIWEKQISLIQKYLAPGKWFLSIDEIRAGGSCRECKNHPGGISEILGNCITRLSNLIRKDNPNADIYLWSDMLDPNHNSHSKFCMLEGDPSSAWKYMPKNIIICCWYHLKRDMSLEFFSERGFRTIGAAYYDHDYPESWLSWLNSLSRTPKAKGIMYTTWSNNYSMLKRFAEDISKFNEKKD